MILCETNLVSIGMRVKVNFSITMETRDPEKGHGLCHSPSLDPHFTGSSKR
jgi:hypothetical protein